MLFKSSFVCPTVLHSLKQFTTASTGIPNLPEFVATLEVDELLMGSCDSYKRVDVKQDIVKSFYREYPELLDWYNKKCFHWLQ